MVTFSQTHPLAAPRARLTRRAVVWAADAFEQDDTTVSALARRLDVDWHTLWDALAVEAERRAADPARLVGVESLGVDEHIWRPGKFGAGREVTCMVDLSRDANGQVRVRPLDLVLGRSGPSYGGWITAQPAGELRQAPLRLRTSDPAAAGRHRLDAQVTDGPPVEGIRLGQADPTGLLVQAGASATGKEVAVPVRGLCLLLRNNVLVSSAPA